MLIRFSQTQNYILDLINLSKCTSNVRMYWLNSFIYKIRSNFVLLKFNTKKKFLALPFTQLFANNKGLQISDMWDQTFFPNYGKQKIRIKKDTSTDTTTSKFTQTSSWVLLPNFIKFAQGTNLPLLGWGLYLNIMNFALRWALNAFTRSIGEGFIYIRGLLVLFFFDAMLTDDEPLWEPVEWSLVQTWIMFIFAFAWIGENLITSRFGSYTGRDKRVWISWYKTFWLIEGWYVLSLGAAAMFVIVPFYHEINYTLPLVVSWWNWYSRIFFFKFIATYSIILYLAYYLQLNLGTFHWKKSLALILVINIFLSYLLYAHFFMSFFGYFTDPNWFQKTRLVDYIHLSHEPNKWSWGNSKRDHFSYHKSTTVFWFKNDGPFASAFMLFHILFFLCLFALYIYWLTLFRRVYTTKEVTFTYTTYCVSSLRQFFYYFGFLYLLVIISFVVQYWRLPVEYGWIANTLPLFENLQNVIFDYVSFMLSICI
jgi:hypothetical protein